MEPVYVIGVGLTKFIKPRGKVPYPELALEASTKALLDASLNYDSISAGIASYCYGDSTSGQRCFYQLGLTSIPLYNTNNNCSSGSTALHLARTLIHSGTHSTVLVLGFEQMARGSLTSPWNDRTNPIDRTMKKMVETRGYNEKAPGAAQLFGNAGKEYMERYGATKEDFAEIARINHAHSKNNPYSQFQDEYTLQQILDSPPLHHPLTKLQACPTSDGAAAAVLCSSSFLATLPPHVQAKAVEIAGMSLTTDSTNLFSGSSMDLVGYDMTARATRAAFTEAGITPKDVSVVELHDCFSANEMVTLDAMGLCEKGKAHVLVRKGGITYGGRYVVNPSGGLISKGHPLGATGVAQLAELTWHLRGWATNRGVNRCEWAIQHNLGLGGAAVVAVYRRSGGGKAARKGEDVVRESGVGYNPAIEARGVSKADVDKVRSKKARSEWAFGDAGQNLGESKL